MKTLCQKILATGATIVALSGLAGCGNSSGNNNDNYAKPEAKKEAPRAFASVPMYSHSGMAMSSGDFDKDGNLDLIVGALETGFGSDAILFFFKGLDNGKFANPRAFASVPMYSHSGMAMSSGDFDKDGNLDLIVGALETGFGSDAHLFYFQGDGKGNFALR